MYYKFGDYMCVSNMSQVRMSRIWVLVAWQDAFLDFGDVDE